MTLDALLARLAGVRKTGKGWVARCPSHTPDRHPSLAICETDDRLLVVCRAGCETAAVCEALGITLADLFLNPGVSSRRGSRTTPHPPTKRELTERLEGMFWRAATAWELRGLRILDAAKGLDPTGWDHATFDRAFRAVAKGYEALRVAEHLHRLAFALRVELLEDTRHGSNSAA